MVQSSVVNVSHGFVLCCLMLSWGVLDSYAAMCSATVIYSALFVIFFILYAVDSIV